MPLQDVSNDQAMINWLRQSGHGHLLDERLYNANPTSSPPPLPPPPPNMPFGQRISSPNFSPPPVQSNILHGQTTSSSSYPPQSASLSSLPPIFGGGYGSSGLQSNTLNRSSSFPQTDFHPSATYGGAGSPSSPLIAPSSHFNVPPYDHQSSPLHFTASPTQFLTPNMNQQQLDMDIENMRRDPNTRVVQRPPQDDVVYKQRVFVRYLQPPTPPAGGTIIVREKQPPPPPPEPPIVIKRAPPPPPTPPPVIIRERPPPIPPGEGTTVIDKIVPPGPKPPRQVVIEQYPPLPPKPQDVIIERWLPMAPRQRRIIYERLPPSSQPATRPIIVQYGPPHVRVQREVITAPGTQLPYQQVVGRTDINQILSQTGGHQQIHSTLPLSSLVSYNPYTTIQPSYGTLGQCQPNIVIMQNGQPSVIPSSPYGMPLTCVCTPNQTAGLGIYGSGISTIPTIGQSMVYNVPDNVPVDHILRQLGIDPYSVQHSTGVPFTDPHSAVLHAWNAASHANIPYNQSPGSAVSHVWNAAAHASDHMYPASPNVGHAWDKIEHYLHPHTGDAARAAWQHIPHPGSPPPSSPYPPPGPPPMNYPPPPSSHYPPPGPPPMNYPPPSANYPPPSANYPPPPPSSYPPAGGPSGAGASVLSRLFGGGR